MFYCVLDQIIHYDNDNNQLRTLSRVCIFRGISRRLSNANSRAITMISRERHTISSGRRKGQQKHGFVRCFRRGRLRDFAFARRSYRPSQRQGGFYSRVRPLPRRRDLMENSGEIKFPKTSDLRTIEVQVFSGRLKRPLNVQRFIYCFGGLRIKFFNPLMEEWRWVRNFLLPLNHIKCSPRRWLRGCLEVYSRNPMAQNTQRSSRTQSN